MGNAVVLLCFVALAVVGALVIIFVLLSSLPLFTGALTPIITDSTNNTVKGPEQVYSIYNQIPLAVCGSGALIVVMFAAVLWYRGRE